MKDIIAFGVGLILFFVSMFVVFVICIKHNEPTGNYGADIYE